MLMMKKLKNLEFEPVHPKNVLLASVVHGISCLLLSFHDPPHPKKNFFGIHLRQMIFIYGRWFEKRIFPLHDNFSSSSL
jgi:hypothetical protein